MGYQHWRYSKDATQTGWLEIDVKDSSVNVLQKQVMLERLTLWLAGFCPLL